MEMKFKLFLTNWINVFGIFIAVYLVGIIDELVKITSVSNLSSSLVTGFIGGLFGIVLYGAIFWIGFIVVMFLLDMALLNKDLKYLRLKLLAEWLIVSSPFIYWYLKYTEWVFLIAVITFAFTQLYRAKKIIMIILSYK